ncbi:MAG TPA: hypothetical protein PKA63_07690 [Oligoflexia bacterium]|nr:hypothetical protein [Oligoflexia bacterium]HMP48531.1 hypothetical protein [Oligoflexia bacterium]
MLETRKSYELEEFVALQLGGITADAAFEDMGMPLPEGYGRKGLEGDVDVFVNVPGLHRLVQVKSSAHEAHRFLSRKGGAVPALWIGDPGQDFSAQEKARRFFLSDGVYLSSKEAGTELAKPLLRVIEGLMEKDLLGKMPDPLWVRAYLGEPGAREKLEKLWLAACARVRA